MQLKNKLFNECKCKVAKRLENISNIISSNQEALLTETKSTAGDKHETGRAMLQLEMEKASFQLNEVNKMNEILLKIDLLKVSEKASLGSVIFTEQGNYFLSVSVGKIEIENQLFFAISTSSPIGKLLLGKQKNNTFIFNNKDIKILEIV